MNARDRVADHPDPGPQLAALHDEVRRIVDDLLADHDYSPGEVGRDLLGRDLTARLSTTPEGWPEAFAQDPILLDLGSTDNVRTAMDEARGLAAQVIAERLLAERHRRP